MTPTESSITITDPCPCANPDCPRVGEYVFVWPEHPFTVNWALNHHHTSVSREIKAWREPFELMAKGAPRLDWCTIVVDHVVPTRRNVDLCAPVLAYKAALDGIVRAGVLEDDDPAHVRRVTFNAPVYERGRDALVLTLSGPVAAGTPAAT